MTPTGLAADGSSDADSDSPRVVLDRTDPAARWRFRCPNGHADWDPTNSHLWCATCAGLHDVDPEYWELLDTKTGERVPWAAVELR
jgi:hypothetical protein